MKTNALGSVDTCHFVYTTVFTALFFTLWSVVAIGTYYSACQGYDAFAVIAFARSCIGRAALE